MVFTRVGNNLIQQLYYGEHPLRRLYHGEDLIWGSDSLRMVTVASDNRVQFYSVVLGSLDSFLANPVPVVSGGSGTGAAISSVAVNSSGDITGIVWASGGQGYQINDVLSFSQGFVLGTYIVLSGDLSLGGVLQNLSGIVITGSRAISLTAIGGLQSVDVSSNAGVGMTRIGDDIYAVTRITAATVGGQERSRLYTINQATGEFTSIGSPQNIFATPSSGIGLGGVGGNLYAATRTGLNRAAFFSGNRSTGAFTLITDGFARNVLGGSDSGIGLSSVGRVMYAAAVSGGNRARLYTVDPASGLFTDISTVDQSVYVDGNGGISLATVNNDLYAATVGATNQLHFYRINRTAGTFAAIGGLQTVVASSRGGIGMA